MKTGLQFDVFGCGLIHFAAAETPKPCPKCHGTGTVGDPRFAMLCTICRATGVAP